MATDFQQNSDVAYTIAVQPDGKILVGGATSRATGMEGVTGPGGYDPTTFNQFALARYNSDGSLDTAFGVQGRVVTDTGAVRINCLALQADGKIIAIGPEYSYFVNAGSVVFARYDGTGPRIHYIATGAGAGGAPHVKVFDAVTGQLKFSFFAFDPRFGGGVRVATGDVNGDGVDDIICAAGPGGGPEVRVFDGTDGHLIRDFYAYDPAFTGGVYVAAGDVNGDGLADIMTGAGEGGGPHVRVFDGASLHLMDEFMAYDSGFRGGVRVAAADVNGDGLAEIVTGAGPGGGPHVEVFDDNYAGPVVYTGPVVAGGAKRVRILSTYAFAPEYSGGVFVAAGDVDGDGKAEIIAGQGQGWQAKVRVIRASDLQVLAEAVPFANTFTIGVDVAACRSEILVAPGFGSPTVRILNGATLAQVGEFTAYDPGFLGGVFVG